MVLGVRSRVGETMGEAIGETLLERKGELALVEGEDPNKRDR